MGGIIEDKIFEALLGKRFGVKEIQRELKGLKPPYFAEYPTLTRHLRKMVLLKQVSRKMGQNGIYIYWNPAMEEKQ